MSAGDRMVRAANLTWLVTLIVYCVLYVIGAPVRFMGGVIVVGIAIVAALFVAAFRTLKEKP